VLCMTGELAKNAELERIVALTFRACPERLRRGSGGARTERASHPAPALVHSPW